MKIPCISCQSLFHLDNNLIAPTGSKVRCSKCKNIFMVYPPTANEEPVIQAPDIDQTTIFDLFKGEQKNRIKKSPEETTEAKKSYGLEEITSIRDFEEEEEEPDSEVDNIDYTG